MAHLPAKSRIRVLDAFHGQGLIWEYIRQKVKIKIEVTAIDRKPVSDELVLFGDNRKFLPSLSLEKFDVIDLDSYGVPFEQLEHIFDYDKKKKIHHRVFVTFIQSIYGRLPVGMLKTIGYSEKMIEKVPTLFDRDGLQKFKAYLALKGVSTIFIKSSGKKHYLFFET